MLIALEHLIAVCPRTKRARLEIFVEPLNATFEEFTIDSMGRQSAFLAQVAHETGGFRYMEEIADGSKYDGREDLGNTDPRALEIATRHGSTPGRWWKGHGGLQTTGYKNHLLCGEALGLDLLESPRLIAEPVDAMRSAGWFWVTGAGLNLSRRARRDRGIPVGVNLNDLADEGRFEDISIAINGWLNGYADRLTNFRNAQGAYA